jgi:hypothetical protein
LLIDGFGWRQWLQYAERYDFFNRVTARGVVAPITTVFPPPLPRLYHHP